MRRFVGSWKDWVDVCLLLFLALVAAKVALLLFPEANWILRIVLSVTIFAYLVRIDPNF